MLHLYVMLLLLFCFKAPRGGRGIQHECQTCDFQGDRQSVSKGCQQDSCCPIRNVKPPSRREKRITIIIMVAFSHPYQHSESIRNILVYAVFLSSTTGAPSFLPCMFEGKAFFGGLWRIR